MIYLGLPLGTSHGWGVCGRMVTRELARLGPVELYTNQFHPQLIEDELEAAFLVKLLPAGADPMRPSEGRVVPGPVLRGIPAFHDDFKKDLKGTFNVGYCFFEDNLLAATGAERQFSQFDCVACGSTWCAEVLRATGKSNVEVV